MKKIRPSLEVQRWTIMKHMVDDLGGVLDYDAKHVDAIRKRFEIQGSELMYILLHLEKEGLVMRDKEKTLFVLTEDGLKTLNPDYPTLKIKPEPEDNEGDGAYKKVE